MMIRQTTAVTAILVTTLCVQAGEFDLRTIGQDPNATVTFIDTPDERQNAKVYEVRVKNDRLRTQTSVVAVGPFQAVDGEILIGDDNVAGNLNRAKDTGRSFSLGLRGTYTNGEDKDMVVAFTSTVFTNPAGKSTFNSKGRRIRPVDSTEQNRVSLKVMKFKDGHYVIGGVGAEQLTNDGAISRSIQQAYHEAALGDTNAEFAYSGRNGPSGVSADASIGIGREITTKDGSVQAYFIPQVVAQASTTRRNTQVIASAEAGVRAGPTQISGYAEKGVSLGRDSSLLGLRIDQKLTGGKRKPGMTVFVAVERRKDALDRWYGAENKRNKNLYWTLGVKKTLGGARAVRSSGVQ